MFVNVFQPKTSSKHQDLNVWSFWVKNTLFVPLQTRMGAIRSNNGTNDGHSSHFSHEWRPFVPSSHQINFFHFQLCFTILMTFIDCTDMANLQANPKHNVCAYLDPTTTYGAHYAKIIEFMNRSRIHFAISTKYDAYKSHQQLFWRTWKVLDQQTPVAIVGKIMDQTITITEDSIRQALHFNDSS